MVSSGRLFSNLMVRTLALPIVESRIMPTLLLVLPSVPAVAAWARMDPVGHNTAIIDTASTHASPFADILEHTWETHLLTTRPIIPTPFS